MKLTAKDFQGTPESNLFSQVTVHGARSTPLNGSRIDAERVMLSSWRVGTISNIPVRFHWTMVALPLFVLFRGYFLESSGEVFLQLSLVFALYACLVFREAGHVLVCS